MKFIAFIQSHIEIKKILKHSKLWPVEYPEISGNARASPNNLLNLDLLSKQVNSKPGFTKSFFEKRLYYQY